MSQVRKPPSIAIDASQPDIDCSRIEIRRVAAFWAEFIDIKKDALKKYGDVCLSFDRMGKRLRTRVYGTSDGDRKLLATIIVGKTKGGITWEI